MTTTTLRAVLGLAATATLLATAAGCEKIVQIHETPVADPSFSADIAPIFEANCVYSGCHTSGREAGGLDLETGPYAALVSVPSDDVPSMARVTPANSAASYLWHKLNGTQDDVGGAGAQMPRWTSELAGPDLITIENWILGGALDN